MSMALKSETETKMDMNTETAPQRGFKDLYGSQQRGVTHLYEHDATQFVAPMGYGKTAVAMTAIGELLEDKVIRAALTIAPKRVAQLVWPREAEEWAHLKHLRISVVDGGPASRKAKLLAGDADIYVVGVDNVPWLVGVLRTLPDDHPLFDLLCVDELSRLKAPRGKWSKALRGIAHRFRARWGLTGTPRPNGYQDQFAPLGVISANKLWGKTFDQWRGKHFYPTDYGRFNWAMLPGHEALLEADIAKYTVTVSDADMKDLPELVVRDHWVELPEQARAGYRRMEKKLVADFNNDPVVAANAGVATIKLAQIAQGFLYDDNKHAAFVHTAKSEMLQELVDGLDGDPALLVYEFQADLDVMRRLWPDLRWLGQGTTDAQAKQNEADWNVGKIPLLALHPAAAGHGLNLQHGGNQMIWYGLTWSPELYEQTIKRIHRQGQKRRCFIHRILARATLDEAKLLRVDHKLSEQEAFKQHLRRV